MTMPHKTAKEAKLEAKAMAFWECLHIFEEVWRERVNNHYRRTGQYNETNDWFWTVIEKAQKTGDKYEGGYKDLLFARIAAGALDEEDK
jgi:hypothetical protein